ncbi:MAG: CoA-binding protein [Mycoplasma sp.]
MISNDSSFFDKAFKNLNELSVVLLGDTEDETKKAYEIKALLKNKVKVLYCVDKDIDNLNNIPEKIDLIILCMNKFKSKLLLDQYDNLSSVKYALFQPGAESEELIKLFDDKKITHSFGCVIKYYEDML